MLTPQSELRPSRRTARVEVVVIEAEHEVSIILDGSPFSDCPRSFGIPVGKLTGPTGTLHIFEVVTIYGIKRHLGSVQGHFEPGDAVKIFSNPELKL